MNSGQKDALNIVREMSYDQIDARKWSLLSFVARKTLNGTFH